MNLFIFVALCIVTTIAEPPVNNRYLPPQSYSGSGGGGSPAQAYGPPNRASVFDAHRGHPSSTNSIPSSTYGAPSFNSRAISRRPSSQPGPPQRSSQYKAPSTQLSSQYLPPSNQYLPAQHSNINKFRGSTNFGHQSGSPMQAASPGIEYGTPSQQYEAPKVRGSDQYSRHSVAPSDTYGAPEQSRSYLPPKNGGYGGDEEKNAQSASYSFEYMVKDEKSGNDFGHRESREGSRAEGVYFVLLPDGRKQTVTYEADEEGYRPKISYEDTDAGAGGYGKNAQASGGY